jgi:aminomethyltransferase
MVDFSGWLMPVQYTSIVKEHRATRNSVGLFDISHMGRFRFDGDDAADFLDSIVTRRVVDLAAGKIRYSLVTNEAGGILDDVLVYRLNDPDGAPFFMLVVNAGNRKKIADWISSHLTSDRAVQFQDQTRDTAMIAVQGPGALGPGSKFSGAVDSAARQPILSLVDVDLTELDYYTGTVCKIAGQPGVASRTGYTGEDGYELIVQASVAMEVWSEILAASAAGAALPVGLGARDTLRLEAAMPLYGHELSEAINPYQAGLRFAVQLRDRQFIGSDALRALKTEPEQARRIGLELSGRRVPREHYAVFPGGLPGGVADGQQIGQITSGTFSPTLERPIAMAYVRPEFAALGTELAIDIRGKQEPAMVVQLPFYSR